MEWYLRKATGEQYGPADLDTLRAWAAEGRVAPDDAVSRDRQHWTPATDEVLLEIEWTLVGESAAPGAAYHLGVFEEWMKAGAVSPETPVRNVRTGRMATLRELLGADEAPSESPETEAAGGPPETPAVERIPESATWQALARERDALADEARKWRALHDEIAAAARRRERECDERIRALESEAVRLQNALEHERRDLEALREDRATASAAAGESGDWSAAYHAIAASFRTLSEELEGRSREANALREELARVQAEAEERVRVASALAAKERSAANEARRAMAELERAHEDVIRSLRELNDRYIRLRERQSESPSPAEGSAAPAVGSPASTSAPIPGRRIRLTR